MSMNLGINLVEVNGATPSIQGAPTSVAGFVIRSQRGVPGQVVQVSSFAQFTDHFGSYMAIGNVNGTQTSYVGAYALRGFFDNGGTLAYVYRVSVTAAPTAGQTYTAAAPATHTFGPSSALTVTTAYRGQQDPGEWGNHIAITITANTSNPSVTNAFDLTVSQQIVAATVTTYKILETWTKLVIGGAPGYQDPATVINDPNTGSKYIMVATTGTAAPTAVTNQLLGSGADDNLSGSTTPTLDTVLANVFSTPSPFDPIPVELLACPETTQTTPLPDPVISNALSYCANRGDCMFVGHVPDYGAQPLSSAKSYGQGLQADKVYGALYLPYIQVLDPIGTVIWIPPDGHVLGVYARTDQQRGIWKAPAGDAALVQGALNVRATLNDTDFTDLVKNGSVNAIRPITGAGIVIDSSRTLSTNTLWLYVNVRLLFNFVKTSLKLGLRWVVQEPNDQALWNKIKFSSVTPFLLNLWRQGAFGSSKPSDVFTVKVDAVNNPPANIQQGILNIEVYFFPSRPAETIVITVGQQQDLSTVSEG
jgi:phage tail sheath protein FI